MTLLLLWVLSFWQGQGVPTVWCGTVPVNRSVTTQPLHPVIVRAHVVRRHLTMGAR
jgi:hypothetical protein